MFDARIGDPEGGEVATPSAAEDENEVLVQSDVMLLCDFFSLPYSHGPKAQCLLRTAHWLVSNAPRMRDFTRGSEKPPEVREWLNKAYEYSTLARKLSQVSDKLLAIPNRDILYDLYAYVNDMRSVVWLLNSYFKWNGTVLAFYSATLENVIFRCIFRARKT